MSVGFYKRTAKMRIVKTAEERKNEILDVAEQLFAEKGFDNASTNDITWMCRLMDTTPGTNVDGAFPPWNFNVCTLLTPSSPILDVRCHEVTES